jgi:transposase
MLAAGRSAAAIAKELGVHKATIYNLKYGKTWNWLVIEPAA